MEKTKEKEDPKHGSVFRVLLFERKLMEVRRPKAYALTIGNAVGYKSNMERQADKWEIITRTN